VRAPRVLLACDYFVRYSVGLGRGLLDQGSPVTLLTRSHDLEFGGEPGAMRAYVRQGLTRDASQLLLEGRVRHPDALIQLARTRTSVRRFDPDIVHVQDSVVNDVRLVAAAGIRPRRFAITIHDPMTHPGDRPRPPWKIATWRALLRGAGLIFVHADQLREELIARERPKAPVVVVPHGVEEVSITALPATPRLLFFGRISKYKGLDTLLDAMPIIWQTDPVVELTVAGRGNLPIHPVLADPRITVRAGYIPDADIPSLFERSSCVVLPYRQASQSGVGALATRYGRALIATSVGGLPELVGRETGMIVRPEDPTALAQAVRELFAEPGRAAAMGRTAAESADAETSWRRVGALTLDAYARHLAFGATVPGTAFRLAR